jgi:hypothetical protein
MGALGPQFSYPEDPDRWDPHRAAHDAFGGGVSALFPNREPKIVTPWPSAPRSKYEPPYDVGRVQQEVAGPAHLEEIDPRNLHAMQPWVTLEGVQHYASSNVYDRTGQTFADSGSALNQYPVVWQDARGRRKIVSGHHRAAASLVRGVPLRARLIQE